MKKINIILLSLIVTLACVSCESYDDYNQERKSIVRFDAIIPSGNIEITTNNPVEERQLQAFISDVSSVDRTFDVIIDESNEINPENFTIPSSITIPANQRRATISIVVTNVSLPETYANIVLRISGDANTIYGVPFEVRTRGR